MAYLLDTNHCVYLINGIEKPLNKRSKEESNVIEAVRSLKNHTALCMSEISLGELYYGAALSERESHNLKKIAGLTQIAALINLKQEDWKLFGQTKALLQKSGKKMSDFDLLLACLAKTNHCTIVTNDKGFDNLPEEFPRTNWAGEKI